MKIYVSFSSSQFMENHAPDIKYEKVAIMENFRSVFVQ